MRTSDTERSCPVLPDHELGSQICELSVVGMNILKPWFFHNRFYELLKQYHELVMNKIPQL